MIQPMWRLPQQTITTVLTMVQPRPLSSATASSDDPTLPDRRKQHKRPAPQWRDAAAGALSGALARTALAPVERVKLLST